ncbi:hypothetical protein BgiMline_026431 [Biomphalaria glabrata]|nr:hypothetical protein BgiMline_020916 [Biomphalaria glabrata]
MAAIKQIKHIKKQVKTTIVHSTLEIRASVCTDLSQHECFPSNVRSQMHTLSAFFTRQPFAISSSCSNSTKINPLLSFSLNQQKDEDISRDPGFISLVIHRCLETIGIKSKVVFGERKSDNTHSFEPHVWLVIDGNIIDNCYIEDICETSVRYLQDNVHQCYKECEPDLSILKDIKSIEPAVNLKKCLYFYIKKPDHALALSLNREQYYNYYFAMIRYMHEHHNAAITGVDPRVRYICWYCERYPKGGKNFISDILVQEIDADQWVDSSCSSSWKFFHCKQCMVASYCDKSCQRNDWNEIHNITCLPRGSVCQSPLSPDDD